jgi:acyl-CoA thioesterase FadM
MPRVILAELERYEHRHIITVRATDINYAGHLGNEALLGLVHEARANFLREIGFNSIVGKEVSVGLIIADLAVNFKDEAFARDQVIIESQIGELGAKSFRLFHRLRRAEEVIALVEMGLVAFSYQERKPVSLPAEFLNGLQEYRKHKTESAG